MRAICLALPETTERLSHGEPTFFVGKRVFTMFANNHHNDGHIAVWMPVPEGIVIPFVSSMIDDDGVFTPTEPVEHGATSVLNALARWAEALKPLRSS